MSTPSKSASALHLMLERMSSLFRSQMREVASAHDLKLVQLEVVIYLSVANRYSDTSAAIVDYLGLTKGTVSQTISALERHGALEKVPDPNDGRVLHCRLTEKGKRIAAAAHPASFLKQPESKLQKEALVAARNLLRVFQAGQDFRSFGQCRTCQHFLAEKAGRRCGLTGESLSAKDATKICREHLEGPA